MYKDACNSKSNQQNLATIKSSNLCTEIVEYTSADEIAVCNLASISLKKFVKHIDTTNLEFIVYSKHGCVYCDLAKGLLRKKNITYVEKNFKELTQLSGEYPLGVKFPQIYLRDNSRLTHVGGYDKLCEYLLPEYDYISLEEITRQLTLNLNNIIDYNYYPVPETKRSNLRHRPIGIGVQGLANVFLEFNYSFDSNEAKELNEKIFETIYYASMKASMEISKEREAVVLKYKNGLQQLRQWTDVDNFVPSEEMSEIKRRYHIIPEEMNIETYLGSYSTFQDSPLQKGNFQFDLWNKQPSNRYDWNSLMLDIQRYGVRNSLLVAPMPTASTAQILGNYECFEPIMTNIYTRRVLAGEYMVINDYLIEDLISLKLWSPQIKDKLIENDGSIQNIEGIPQIIKNKYKTIWEIKQKHIINMAIDRGKYICQSQSMNLFIESPDTGTLTSMHFYAWKNGLKTGIYYLRSRPSSKAIQFTIEPDCENCSA